MQIAVIGLGKIGLPLAAQFAASGHHVVGVDINPGTVDTINAGREPFPGEAHLQEHLDRLVPSGHLRATTDYADAVPQADAVVVVVPLFVDPEGRPDFGWMDSATRDMAANLTAGTLISYETTLPVGTTRDRWRPMLEEGSGLAEGTDFHLAFSPERVLTGRVFEDLRKYPKLIGGLSDPGAKAARDFYEAVLQFDERPDLARGNGVWDLGSAEAAEMTKLAETTYRDVNIGLANQFALFAETSGIDVLDVISAANSQPFSHIHNPGISVGGHCIPVYPRLYLSSDPAASIVSAARDANEAMPFHAIQMLERELGTLTDATIVILGAAYRARVKETAFSGVFPLARALIAKGALPVVHDPLYSPAELTALGLDPHSMGSPATAAILHTDHSEYQTLTPFSLPGVRAIVDGRAALDPQRWDPVPVLRVGGPGKASLHGS